VVGRNKIHPKFAEEVWVIVEVLDEVSGVYRVRPEDEQGYEKVLHGSNLRPLRTGYCGNSAEQQEQSKGPQHVEEGQIAEEGEEGRQEEEEVEMPDMTEVLRRFGFNDESPSSVESQGEEEGRGYLTTIPECEEEAGQEGEADEVVGLERREPARLRRSRRLAEQKRKDGNRCLGCEGCARGHAQSSIGRV